jgi:hypothetical protein
MAKTESKVRLDLNNPEFQDNVFGLEKKDRQVAVECLKKISGMTWNQVYRDQGLKWEKIVSIHPPKGIDALYSFRISQSRRAMAFREGDFLRLLTIPPDHDATYKKT